MPIVRDTPLARELGYLIDRFNRLFGANSFLSANYYNRILVPSKPNIYDAEMETEPDTRFWSWVTHPSAINGISNVNYTQMPGFQYVYIYGAGSGVAEQRCTVANPPGNFPRFKGVILGLPTIAPTGWQFTFRSCKDSNNYTEWQLTPGILRAYKCLSGTRTQVGSDVPVATPLWIWLSLSNMPGSNFLYWGLSTLFPGQTDALPVTASDPGLQAADITYIQLLYQQPSVAAYARYFVDAVRFSSSDWAT